MGSINKKVLNKIAFSLSSPMRVNIWKKMIKNKNIPKYMKKIFDDVVNISLNETLNRTVITSLTTMMVVVILFVWGGKVINLFAFALIVGVFVGTYSSLFVASPVMAFFEKKSKGQKRR